ncbi:TPA: hypothetical protein RI759_003494, partial [Vibrio cholerae]|nr:hypothetical protein [Vibrio cholerae]
MNNQSIDEIIQLYESERHYFERFMNGVVDTFKLEPRLNKYGSPIIYTIKNRLKDVDHLRDKLVRKWDNENPITPDNFFQRVTDLAGVRVLHLYQDQFSILHEHINKQVESGDWFLKENPVAYSWDPESTSYFQRLGIDSKIKDSYYTSI